MSIYTLWRIPNPQFWSGKSFPKPFLSQLYLCFNGCNSSKFLPKFFLWLKTYIFVGETAKCCVWQLEAPYFLGPTSASRRPFRSEERPLMPGNWATIGITGYWPFIGKPIMGTTGYYWELMVVNPHTDAKMFFWSFCIGCTKKHLEISGPLKQARALPSQKQKLWKLKPKFWWWILRFGCAGNNSIPWLDWIPPQKSPGRHE